MFLHGYLSCKESFSYQINALKSKRRIIAVDLRGFGESSALPFAYSLSDYVNDVKDLITALKIERYDVVAHSFGGRIALRLATADSRVDKIVLTGSAGLKPKRSLKYYFKVYLYKLLKKFISEKNLKNFGSKDYVRLSPVMKKSFIKIVNEHLDKELKNVNNKTLIIFGKNDKETPLYFAKKLKKEIKNSYLIVIENAGHFAFVDNPNAFNLYLKEFLFGDDYEYFS